MAASLYRSMGLIMADQHGMQGAFAMEFVCGEGKIGARAKAGPSLVIADRRHSV